MLQHSSWKALLYRHRSLYVAKERKQPPFHFQLVFLSSLAPNDAIPSCLPPPPPPPPPLSHAVDTVFHILTTSKDVKQSLKSIESSISFSTALIDQVLKRVRFSHSDPLPALELFEFTSRKEGFIHSDFSLNTMLYVLGRSRRFDIIWPLLNDIKTKDQSLITPRTVHVVLGRIAKICSVRETVESFHKFRKLVDDFDTNCYNALLRSLCQEKSMTDARSVYHSLKHKFSPNLQTFNILLAGWKSLNEAETFFEEMKHKGIDPDVVSYNCLVDICCKEKEIDKAFQLVNEMRERHINPNVITYTSLIGGLGLAGQPDKSRELLKEMREYGCYPDAAAYNAVIKNFCIAKRIGDAYALMDEMVSKGLSPNATTYNVFLRSFYWCNDLDSSWSLYMKMKETRCLPSTQSCMYLIRMMSRQEKVDLALELWNDMVTNGFGSHTLVSDVLFPLLCDMGKLEEAEKCFLQMVEKGQKPSNVSFTRIKALMQSANKHDSLASLSAKMKSFFTPIKVERRIPSERNKVERRIRKIKYDLCLSD